MKPYWTVILAFLLVAVPSPRVLSGDPRPAVADEAAEEGTTEAAGEEGREGIGGEKSEKAEAPISGAEILADLQTTIQADKKRLAELKRELQRREKGFKATDAYLRKAEKRLAEKRKALEKLGDRTDDRKAKQLRTEIKVLEQDLTLLKERADLDFQEVKTTKEQIEILRKKIEKDTDALERLQGKKEPEGHEIRRTPPAAPSTATPTAASLAAKAMPGMPGESGGGAGAGEQGEETPTAELDTAEQIEARKQAEKKEEEAREAAQAIIEHVERKEALKEQISLEKESLKNARQRLVNIKGLLETRKKLMDDKITAGAPREELQRLRKEIRFLEAEMQKLRADIDARNDHLTTLYEQLERIREEQIRVMEEAESKRAEAERARKRSLWLDSPLYPRNIVKWAVTRGPRMLAIVLATWLLLLVVRFVLKRAAKMIMMSGRREVEQRQKRATTLGSTLTSTATGFIVVGGTLLALEEAGVNIQAVLGGAAVIGLAVAFGAQNLMRDYFSGFMILMEGQFELNDIVTIGNVTGSVERMSMRMTLLRDLEGRAHFIPNGQIRQVTNRTHGWSQALFDIGIDYRENADRVMAVLMEVAEEFRRDPVFGPFTLWTPRRSSV